MFIKPHLIVFFSLLNVIFFSGCGGSSKPAIVQNTASISNSSPVVTSTAVNIARIGSSYQYLVKATDEEDASNLSYHLFSAPDGMRINTHTGLITWEPTLEQLGNHIIIVQVKDNGKIIKAGYQSFPLTVIAHGNSGGVLDAQPDFIKTKVNQEVEIAVLENDQLSDGDSSITISVTPSNGAVRTLQNNTVVYTPNPSFSGIDKFTYTLSNRYESQQAIVTIAVGCSDCYKDKIINLSWNPSVTGKDAGYLIYYGNHEDTANRLVFDLSTFTGLNQQSPSVQLSVKHDLGLETGDRVCFRISAYILYAESGLSEPICGTV